MEEGWGSPINKSLTIPKFVLALLVVRTSVSVRYRM